MLLGRAIFSLPENMRMHGFNSSSPLVITGSKFKDTDTHSWRNKVNKTRSTLLDEVSKTRAALLEEDKTIHNYP